MIVFVNLIFKYLEKIKFKITILICSYRSGLKAVHLRDKPFVIYEVLGKIWEYQLIQSKEEFKKHLAIAVINSFLIKLLMVFNKWMYLISLETKLNLLLNQILFLLPIKVLLGYRKLQVRFLKLLLFIFLDKDNLFKIWVR